MTTTPEGCAEPVFARHGGALDAAIARYGGRREDWLDLSTGINPRPAPLPDLSMEAWTRLPERGMEERLREAARRAYGAGKEAGIVAAPGSQAIISNLPFLFAPTSVAVLDPSYREHSAAFAAAGHDVRSFHGLADIPTDARIVVVVNPNNPDGRRFAPRELLALRERLASRGGLLIVDEAFADAEPDLSLASQAGCEGLLVHRSFGKFYGLAGLRLGFALTTRTLAARLAERLGPWAVSGPALSIGASFLEDAPLGARLRASVIDQGERRDGVFARLNIPILGRTALFATIRHGQAGRLHDALCRRLILTRPFDYAPDWLRIGNPPGRGEAERLEEALAEALAELSGPAPDDEAGRLR
ncbi:threonine-phosphate decarboxylase [Fulvimarina endophytica]|uniref:threonine-phosphate decarboxylase n=1 Tax=Fulvimarina endophytica TaxID=2293836 RepID=A0A371X1E3_9HYPH|nr:threonine-phosphate decarboxylase CobD [Fulvimarina endophytica]RFC63053.1 threonine-phosphate decarboxylase [Fulvimarina endophytica]